MTTTTAADWHDAWVLGLLAMRWSRLLVTAAVFPGALGAVLAGATTSSDVSQPNDAHD